MTAHRASIENEAPGLGAMVISLDFELHWGVRDWTSVDGPYRENLLGAREAVPRMLELFERFDVGATWATVGMLFATDRAELEECSPSVRPQYERVALSPYEEVVGETERDDPLHYGRSLLDLIRATPGQEIASHTFSHYYCLEPGQDADSMRADLESARQIADRYGVTVESLVFPRNQFNPAYGSIVRDLGFSCYRGNHQSRIHRASPGMYAPTWVRLVRLADTYIRLASPGTVGWDGLVDETGLCNIRATRFLRPYRPALKALEPLRLRRITTELDHAARHAKLFHLWWHPHNFGSHLEENLRFLESVLRRFDDLRSEHGMRSLTMAQVSELAYAG